MIKKVLNDAVRRWNGFPLMAHPSDATFLQIDDRRDYENIDAAVCEFISVGSWPKLSYARLRLLLLRVFMARRIPGELLDDDLGALAAVSSLPANLGETRDMVKWLFIDMWTEADAQSRRNTIIDFVSSLTR
jgi:hypothetical protein